MKKLPYLPLYIGDWKKDPCVTVCRLATRAVWVELLCAMHEADRSGEVRGTPEEMAQMCRCSVEEFKLALCQLNDTKTARVTIRNGNVTVVNRRMAREYKERKANALRQKRHRQLQKNNAPSSMSSSISRSTVDRQDDRGCATGAEQIRFRVAQVIERIGRAADSPDDRSLVLKSAILSTRAPFSEHWLYDAAEGVARSKSRKGSHYGYFHACLKNAAKTLGRDFNRELAKVRIPTELLEPGTVVEKPLRLCEAAE